MIQLYPYSLWRLGPVLMSLTRERSTQRSRVSDTGSRRDNRLVGLAGGCCRIRCRWDWRGLWLRGILSGPRPVRGSCDHRWRMFTCFLWCMRKLSRFLLTILTLHCAETRTWYLTLISSNSSPTRECSPKGIHYIFLSAVAYHGNIRCRCQGYRGTRRSYVRVWGVRSDIRHAAKASEK